MHKHPFTDDEISAYIDGELNAERVKELEQCLISDLALQTRVDQFRQLNHGIRSIFDQYSNQTDQQQDFNPFDNAYKYGLAASLIAIGLFLGLILANLFSSNSMNATPIEYDLLKPASFAHAVYTTDQSHPVEVKADAKDHLNQWLSNRLHTSIKAPNLESMNYQLIGGRLLPSTNRMAAQFMYQQDEAHKVTIYLRRGVWTKNYQSFQFANVDSANIFYWVEGAIAYAVVGDLNRIDLLKVAETVQQQL